jgi:hypothetical protein
MLPMDLSEHFNHFYETIPDDPRISAVHISLYMALLLTFEHQARENPVAVHRAVLMKQAKISARSTYYKAMRELELFGYIRYQPSRNLYLESRVYIIRV